MGMQAAGVTLGHVTPDVVKPLSRGQRPYGASRHRKAPTSARLARSLHPAPELTSKDRPRATQSGECGAVFSFADAHMPRRVTRGVQQPDWAIARADPPVHVVGRGSHSPTGCSAPHDSTTRYTGAPQACRGDAGAAGAPDA